MWKTLTDIIQKAMGRGKAMWCHVHHVKNFVGLKVFWQRTAMLAAWNSCMTRIGLVPGTRYHQTSELCLTTLAEEMALHWTLQPQAVPNMTQTPALLHLILTQGVPHPTLAQAAPYLTQSQVVPPLVQPQRMSHLVETKQVFTLSRLIRVAFVMVTPALHLLISLLPLFLALMMRIKV